MFLPTTRKELGGEQADFICITGDAYVDHPSFGIAIVSRLLQSRGFTVGIIAQPVTDSDFLELGAPKHCFLISSGNIDSMVSNYTVSGKKRNDDDYSPGGKGGRRPDYAVNVYCTAVRRLFPKSGIVIGGLEASLRRFAHYDYWTDCGYGDSRVLGEYGKSCVLPSILVSSGADLLIYGMAELTLIQLADRLRSGEKLTDIHDLRGTCYVTECHNTPRNSTQCDNYDIISEDSASGKKCYAKAAVIQHNEQDEVTGKTVTQRHGNVMLVQQPLQRSLTQSEMDKVYALPFMRTYHPMYQQQGGVPAIEEVEFSVTWTRGCFGGCNFCSIALHQGRRIQTRSEESVVSEVTAFLGNKRFKGYVHDVGGPTANFGQPSCKKQLTKGMCKRKCLVPTPCANLEVSHAAYLRLLRRLRKIDGVKKVFVRSGIRYDYVMADSDTAFFDELVQHHVSGQLKVAPEHCTGHVLACMGKPSSGVYDKFAEAFRKRSERVGKKQYLIPYLMSSHPGATLDDAVALAMWLEQRHIRPEQVQDFYPTPGTLSTAMYYTGLNPHTLQPLYVAKSERQKATQRALLQYYKPENRELFNKLKDKSCKASRPSQKSNKSNNRSKLNAKIKKKKIRH